MNKWIVILFFILAPFGSFAQAISASLEINRKMPIPNHFEYVREDKGLVTLGNMTKRSSRYLGLSKFDDSFEKEWTRQVLEQNGRNNIDFMTVMGDQIMVFISEFFPRDGMIRTWYSQYDLEGNDISEKVLLSESPNEKEHRVDLQYVRSINKRRLLCYKILDNDQKKEIITYTMFNEFAEVMLSGDLNFPYADDKMEVRKISISNNGVIYVLAKYYVNNRGRDPDDFSFMIFRFLPGKPEPEEVRLDFGDVFITDLTFKVDKEENIYVAGFFSNKSSSQIIGTVYQKLNSITEREVTYSEKFTEEFLSNFLSDRQIGRGAELKYFYLDDIVLRSDGGVVLIGEKFYTTFNTFMDRMGYWVDQKVHHYDEIIIVSVSNEGKQEWSSMVSKRQSSESNLNLSYLDVITGGNVYLIYEYQPRKMPRTIYINRASLGGEVSNRIPLMGKDSRGLSFYPRSSEQISNREAIMFYRDDKNKSFYLVKMEFQ